MNILKAARFFIFVGLFFISSEVFSFELSSVSDTKKSSTQVRRLDFSDFRFGGGAGYSLYATNQMDYKITRNFDGMSELIYSYHGGFSKVVNSNFEWGLQFRNGHLMTLKSENTQGSTCDFNDLQFNVDYSLNNNAGLNKGNFTANARIGLGGTIFRSKYFVTDPEAEIVTRTIASVGYNGEILSVRDQKEKQKAIIGNIGAVLGFRLNSYFSLYWETTLNLSTSNKMSGNLMKRSWIPTDGYFFSGVGLYVNFGNGKSNRLGCPKF